MSFVLGVLAALLAYLLRTLVGGPCSADELLICPPAVALIGWAAACFTDWLLGVP